MCSFEVICTANHLKVLQVEMDATDKIKKKRFRKKKINKQRARLIVRNLDFSTTEETLREHFERFGDVDEIKVLKKDDGQLTGCGFVQFKLVQNAAKARHYSNGTKFLNRVIDCDWAVAKDKYVKQKKVEVKVKEEPTQEDEVEIKEEIKVENENQDDSGKDSDENDSDVESVDGSNDEDDDMLGEDEEDDMLDEEEEELANPKHFSNDIVEGKTIFIKNAPFTATNEDIKKCFSKFGPLYYALVCMDHLTEHSKGSAFIKFVNKEDADKCLATKDIILMGHTLDCQVALSKQELSRSNDQNKNMKSDSRNLYLVKEGVVYAGSKAADNVSAADMGKRLQLEKYKTNMLKNLSMCVAKTRLVVHNIPSGWNDSKLKTLFQKFAGPNAVIKEARIMKNMRGNAQSFGQSKEFGFVTFTTHEAALQALRSINNNPNIFSANKRPIIAFSIEDRSKLRVKEKRLINSKLKNPNYKEKLESKDKTQKGKKKQKTKNNEDIKSSNNSTANDDDERPVYSGTKGKPGETKLRGNFKLRVQALVHREQLKKQKRKNSVAKKALKEVVRQEKQENKKKLMFDDNFSKTIQNYKKMLVNTNVDRKKWHE